MKHWLHAFMVFNWISDKHMFIAGVADCEERTDYVFSSCTFQIMDQDSRSENFPETTQGPDLKIYQRPPILKIR